MAPAGHRLKTTKHGCKQCLNEKAVAAAANHKNNNHNNNQNNNNNFAYKHVRVRRYKDDTMEVDSNANNVIDVHGSKWNIYKYMCTVQTQSKTKKRTKYAAQQDPVGSPSQAPRPISFQLNILIVVMHYAVEMFARSERDNLYVALGNIWTF